MTDMQAVSETSESRFGRLRLGREVATELLKAMGLPVEGCGEVDVDLPIDGFATVSIRYPLTAEALEVCAAAMKREPK